MFTSRLRLLPTLVVALVAALPESLVAHHGAATLDTTTEVVLKGTVTEWLWFNPHCFLKLDVTGEGGQVKAWTVETGNPTDMTKRGWARRSFQPGDHVVITVQPARNGAPIGRMMKAVLADGTTLQ